VTAPARLDDFFAAAAATTPSGSARILDTLPDGVSVTFDLQGEDGGMWTVTRRDGRLGIGRFADPNADCRLTCTVADFRALIRGDLDPRRGFFERRLAVEGDVGLVLRLHRSVL
jgi:putative sterol carrier protein